MYESIKYVDIYSNPKVISLIENYIAEFDKSLVVRKQLGIPISIDDDDPLLLKKSYEILKKLSQKYDLKNKKILEIGSGFGTLVFLSRINNLQVDGIEPCREMVNLSHKLLEEYKFKPDSIKCSAGERLPYADNTFDMVVSFQVLEHVNDPEKILSESLRVLKSGGILHFVFPNYNSFYEGHIKSLWLPFFNKKNTKILLKILGEPDDRFNGMNFLNPKIVRKMISRKNAILISMGKENFREMFNLDNLNKVESKSLRCILKLFFFLKLNVFLEKIFITFEWYYPIVLVLRKK